MIKQAASWKKGRGKLGIFAPLIGTWNAEARLPAGYGSARCTRTFTSVLRGTCIQLSARWEFDKGVYEEIALFGYHDGRVTFWSFTSDGKRSQGFVADGRDVHPQAIAFEAQMPAGLARQVYWPNEEKGFDWAVEAKSK